MLASSDVVADAEFMLSLFQVPAPEGRTEEQPTLVLAASSTSKSWSVRTAELKVGPYAAAVQIPKQKSVLGRTAATVADGNASANIDVQLIDRGHWLTSCDDEAIACGANLAIIGNELLQFTDALPLGDGRFRLSGLVRGLAGTEAKSHIEGEAFVLAQPHSLRIIRLPAWTAGKEAVVRARLLNGEEAIASTIVTDAPSAPLRARWIEVDGEQVVGAREPGIPSPAGGSTVDLEARATIQSLLGALRRHGLIES